MNRLYNQEGTNRQEAYHLRNIARQKLNTAIAHQAAYAAALVTAVIGSINEASFHNIPAERLLARIEYQVEAHSSQITIDSLTGAYPEFQEQARRERIRFHNEHLSRLQEALAPHNFRRRFGSAHRLQRHSITA